MLNDRIKIYLDDIIDVAFAGESVENIKKYKSYNLKILNKECRTSGGMYIFNGCQIQVYNPSLGTKHLAKCCLHELSHHIDYMKHGTSGHQKPFYEIYEKLIFASLNMGILQKEDFDDKWAADQNKVRKIVARYIPEPVDYMSKEMKVIKIKNGFNIKNSLRKRGYTWNALEQVWEINYTKDEYLFLYGCISQYPIYGKPYFYIEDTGMYINAIITIEASGNITSDILKPYGFYYNKYASRWQTKIHTNDAEELFKKLRNDKKLTGISFKLAK